MIGIFCGLGGALYVYLHRRYVLWMRGNKRLTKFLQKNRFIYPFLVSWLIFMPVAALVVAPVTLAVALLSGFPPSTLLNSLVALLLSGVFAVGTVRVVFRVPLRRAQARRAAEQLSEADGQA